MALTDKDKNKNTSSDKSPVAKTTKKVATNTTKKATKKKSAKADEQDDEKITAVEYYRFGGGGLLSLSSVFILLSIVSYFFTGAEDYKYATDQAIKAANIMGSIGAKVAYWFVTCNFGFASIFLAIFLFMAGVRIMDVVKVRLWKWFINCGILTVWFSCFISCLTDNILSGYNVYQPGGETGYNLMSRLDEQIGPFRYVVLLVIAIAYLCYLSSETINVIRSIMRKPVDIINERRNKNEETIIDPETGEVIKAEAVEEEREDEETEEEEIDPETGEIISKGSDKDTIEWEFRGGEDGPDHPTKAEETPKQIDKHTATTILFDIEGKEQETNKEETKDGKQLDLFSDNFEVGTGVEEEKANTESHHAGNVAATAEHEIPGMTVNVGKENEEANPDEYGALEPYDPKLDLENYRYPTLDLLKKYDIDTRAVNMEEQNTNKNQIITALRNFGVEISSIKATVGPTITLYEITPAPGVRISKIRNLEDDIALSLSALGIRIIAPIPGKGTIGIEVPNANPQIVSMESVINSKKFQESTMELPMALGKTITNEIFMADLAKMPHLLVAGATGQGKSVGLNAIITSLLYKKHPAELKIVMVDPKKVEFSVYSPIVNHFLAQVEGNEDSDEPIITDVTKVIQTLKSLCQEMDTRYDLLKMARARNVKEYNEKFKARQLNPNNGHKFMPYIVVIIDEFGDLIMTAGKEIELPIARIAQLARAVGIHMIIATQRPTTNIITGTIKANFPARIAFKVSSMIDSRTILDRPGANQLVGKGDMLFLAGNEPIRVQCAFVDTPEVEKINNFIACQQSYLGPFPLPYVEMEGASEDAPDVDMNHLDAMFEEVARLIVSTQQGSTSMIQRKFSIGYNRAGRLMDQLEVAGIVGPAHGSKPREVLCQSELDLEQKLNSIR